MLTFIDYNGVVIKSRYMMHKYDMNHMIFLRRQPSDLEKYAEFVLEGKTVSINSIA